MSYTQANAEKIIKACDAYLHTREKEVENDRELLIQHEMNRRWPFRAKTREVAIERLKNGYHRIFDPWREAEVKYGAQAERVRRLRSVAVLARDAGHNLVHVDDQGARDILAYIEA